MSSIEERVHRLAHEIREEGLDAVALIPGPNLYYVSEASFHLSERPILALVPATGPPAWIVPRLERGKAEAISYAPATFTYRDGENPARAVRSALDELRLEGARIGIEGRRIRFLEIELLRAELEHLELVDADPLLARLRMTKDEGERSAMRDAVAIAEKALQEVLFECKPGVTEREIASRLVMELLRAGSGTELPFQPIVSTGSSGADPHATPGDRELRAGDLLVIDWGASHDRYFSDVTRTFVVAEEPTDTDLRKAYDAVRAANEAACGAVHPGVRASDVDAAARRVIEEAGFGQFFIHRTGHGLGLEGHEEPSISVGGDTVLEKWMTFTVEPGIYLPERGGVRIEDDVLVTASGAEILTTLSREWTVIGS